MGAAEDGRAPSKSVRVLGEGTSDRWGRWKQNLTFTKVTTLSAEKGNRLTSTIVVAFTNNL